MEFVFFEGALVALAVLEVLGAFAVKHAVVPVAFVFAMSAFPIKDTPPALHSIPKFTFIPTAIRPPKSASPIPLPSLEFPLINVAFFPRPSVHSSTFFFIEPELPNIVIPSREVQLPLTFQLPIVELTMDDLVGVFEEADSTPMRPVNLGLPYIDDLSIFEEFGSIKGRLSCKHSGRTILNDQQLL